jgi:hypothetical protein
LGSGYLWRGLEPSKEERVTAVFKTSCWLSHFLWREVQIGGLRCPSMLRRLKASAASSAYRVTSGTLPCLSPVTDPERLLIE